MKKLALLLHLFALPVAAQQIAITNVNVLPMDRERILRDHVVLVSSGKIGLIAVGYRADLVLVRENPLADIGRLRQPRGVMAGGTWLDAARLDELLAAWAN
jgi:hypothetical protein